MSDLFIRPLRTYDEILAIMPLQRATWGEDGAGGLVPAQMLIHLVRYGGHVLAAYINGQLVGFIIGYIGLRNGKTVMASKRMVVAPPYRNLGVAMRLKLAQRELAIEQRIPLITWTFTPTMSLNAHFNLAKLGGISRQYDRDVYGTDTPLATLGTSDRLLVEYWVHAARVREHAALPPPTPRLLTERLETAPPILNPSVAGLGNWRTPGAQHHLGNEGQMLRAGALIELPANFDEILAEDRATAVAWQVQLRQLLLEWLNGRGYVITDLWHGQLPGEAVRRAFYLLERELDQEPAIADCE